jgi:hypothetical protein
VALNTSHAKKVIAASAAQAGVLPARPVRLSRRKRLM